MCGGKIYFSAILYSTYDLPRKLQWYWIYLGLSVVLAGRLLLNIDGALGAIGSLGSVWSTWSA